MGVNHTRHNVFPDRINHLAGSGSINLRCNFNNLFLANANINPGEAVSIDDQPVFNYSIQSSTHERLLFLDLDR